MYVCVCNETNLMHCLPSVYSVTIPLHVSGLLVAHHKEVTMYVGDSNENLKYLLIYGILNIYRTAEKSQIVRCADP
jgi:hypothetical protein